MPSNKTLAIDVALHEVEKLIDANKPEEAIKELNRIMEVIKVPSTEYIDMRNTLLGIKADLEKWKNEPKSSSSKKLFQSQVQSELKAVIIKYKAFLLPIPSVVGAPETLPTSESSKWSLEWIYNWDKKISEFRSTHTSLDRLLKFLAFIKPLASIAIGLWLYDKFVVKADNQPQKAIIQQNDNSFKIPALKNDTICLIGTAAELYSKNSGSKIAFIGVDNNPDGSPYMLLNDISGKHVAFMGSASSYRPNTACFALAYQSPDRHTQGSLVHRTDENYEQTRFAYDATVVGVVSNIITNPNTKDTTYFVALSGIVKVKVIVTDDKGGGIIAPGDLLVSSNTEGVAMKPCRGCSTQGKTIGKALQNYSKRVQGEILMLVMPR